VDEQRQGGFVGPVEVLDDVELGTNAGRRASASEKLWNK
jgi:hypothetical protein